MSQRYRDIFRRHCRPLAPLPTGTRPRLSRLLGVRAVLFDIYGTLLVSASGDIGTARRSAAGEAFVAALEAVGIRFSTTGSVGVECLSATIEADHAAARARGIEYPEVEITAIWRRALAALAERGLIAEAPGKLDFAQLAVEYEARVNPAWPMPGVQASLAQLQQRGVRLGLVSNAQFYTLELLPALLERTVAQLGFEESLRFFSFRAGEAKPGRTLYRQAVETLDRAGIAPQEVLCVGNDLLNDIAPATAVGFRTALFAGDARSLRWREGDQRVAGVQPDLVVTELEQLPQCV